MNHFFLSPSSAYRWLECPQSVNAPVVSGSSSPAAAWGTAVHESAAQCLEGGGAPLIGSAIPIEGFGDIPVDADFTDCVSAYVDYVKTQKGELLTEVQLDLSTIFPEMSGTADALLLDEDRLHIIDLKTGRGKRVEIGTVEKPNSQLALYGLGGLNLCKLIDHPIEQVTLTIVMPRIDKEMYAPSVSLSASELGVCGESYRKGAEVAASLQGPYRVGSWCRWCPREGDCPELLGFALVEPTTLPAALERIPILESWIAAARKEATELLLAGERIEGWKLIEGRAGNRKWEEEAVVLRTAKSTKISTKVMYTKKLISPTQLERTVAPEAWEHFKNLAVRSPPKPQLAPDADPRPAWGQPTVEFDKED